MEPVVLASADTTQRSEALSLVQYVTQDEAQTAAGSGEVEVLAVSAFNVQDTLPALEGDAETLPGEGMNS